ncbi:MAG: hypothetical protein ABI663_13240 [Chryseolinea sp.]
MLVRLSFVVAFCLTTSITTAQVYVGVTGDFGNQVSLSPQPSKSLIKSPITPSFSIALWKQEQIRNDWYMQYGLAVGLLGYRMKIRDNTDTLYLPTNDVTYSTFWDYITPYLSGQLVFGRSVLIGERNVFFFLGGGATIYGNSESSVSSSVSTPSGGWADDYDYVLYGKEKNLKAFIETSIQTKINNRITMALLYQYHFKSALTGTYNFYNMKDPPSGTLSIAQRAISIVFMVRLGKTTRY